jgi:sulfiredoxin
MLTAPGALRCRYEAHQRLGLPTIMCRVRKANRQVLKMHLS